MLATVALKGRVADLSPEWRQGPCTRVCTSWAYALASMSASRQPCAHGNGNLTGQRFAGCFLRCVYHIGAHRVCKSAQAKHHVVLRPRSSYTVLACASKPLALADHAKRVPPVCACAIMAVNVATSITCTSLESWRDTQSGWGPAQTPLAATPNSEQDYSASDMRRSCRARRHCAFVCCVAAASQIMHARTGSDK